ncbi:MAG: glycoside hydrolase family 113, partial [Planctomycetota bacterium]
MKLRALLLPALLNSLIAAQEEANDPAAEVRGITISTPGVGRDWGSDATVESMRQIKALGGNWVTIHPYASISDGNGRRGLPEGTVRPWSELDPENPPEYLARPIREAHRMGLKILIKPHLAYWGTRFSWRGEIDFDSSEAYQRFFASYEEWIVKVARACRQADAFVVGTELDKTLGYEANWRRIIARIRDETQGPLTYAANWTDFERVPFWDALDVVGIQAYFPLTDRPTSNSGALQEAWESRMSQLRKYAERFNRNIVFTELGYNRSSMASVRPWEYESEDGAAARAIQEACL